MHNNFQRSLASITRNNLTDLLKIIVIRLTGYTNFIWDRINFHFLLFTQLDKYWFSAGGWKAELQCNWEIVLFNRRQKPNVFNWKRKQLERVVELESIIQKLQNDKM